MHFVVVNVKKAENIRILMIGINLFFNSRPPPAPLVVEDPPSSDNASDLEDLKHHLDPAHLDG